MKDLLARRLFNAQRLRRPPKRRQSDLGAGRKRRLRETPPRNHPKIKQKKIEIEGAVLIGRHCQIEDGVRIVDSCIDDFTRIGKNVVIANSAVMDRVIIGDNAEIHDSIIGRHVAVNSSTPVAPQKSAQSP